MYIFLKSIKNNSFKDWAKLKSEPVLNSVLSFSSIWNRKNQIIHSSHSALAASDQLYID